MKLNKKIKEKIRKKGKIKEFFSKIKSKIKKQKKETYKFEEVVLIMLFSLGLGFIACFSSIRIFTGGKSYFSISKDLEKFIDAYYTIVDNYYGEIDKDLIIENAIKGLVGSIGDGYTNYSNSEDTTSFFETVNGTYEGIGCTVANTVDGKIVVVGIFELSPADKAGLKIDDIIIKIDGKDYSGKTSTEVANYIKNNNSGEVKLTVLREEQEVEVTIIRELIEIPTITSKVMEINAKKIGYIDISLFTSVTDTQFKKALEKIEEEKIEGLVIDVRNNNGGYLGVVTDIIDLFLEKGKVIYKLEDETGTTAVKDTTKEKRTYPVAVLVNEASASASEILAGAIKDSYNGYVVGTNTFGKGTVQKTLTLEDGSMIKYTTQKWLTPNGKWVNDGGLDPTNLVTMNEEYYEAYLEEKDNQLQTALDLVSQ